MSKFLIGYCYKNKFNDEVFLCFGSRKFLSKFGEVKTFLDSEKFFLI